MDNALTIDLEEWFHAELVRNKVKESEKIYQIQEAVAPILELLEKHGLKATFFVVGELAKAFPELVCKIHNLGHEIAFHSMHHRPLWEMNEISFDVELGEFKNMIKDILGESIDIKGYRAPTFSINESTKWALDKLRAKGYLYDSSVFPSKNYLYGVEAAPLNIYKPHPSDFKRDDPGGRFFEFPATIYKFGKIKLPIGGGFYLRVLPLSLIVNLFKQINRRRPFTIYIHPWECYKKTPRVKLTATSRFVTYYGTSNTLWKLERILESFSFRPMGEIVEQCIV